MASNQIDLKLLTGQPNMVKHILLRLCISLMQFDTTLFVDLQ